MTIRVRAVGRLKKNDPKSILIAEYSQRIIRLGRQLGFGDFCLDSYDLPKSMSGPAAQDKESAWLLEGMATRNALKIVLDERGKTVGSAEFAALMNRSLEDGQKDIVFLLGGADGHTDAVRSQATHLLSFGKATWPHMLARVMLCEQIYRAMTILAGHPYHRE